MDDISEDVLPNEATGFKNSKIWNMLYNFQKDAALAIINKLEKYNDAFGRQRWSRQNLYSLGRDQVLRGPQQIGSGALPQKAVGKTGTPTAKLPQQSLAEDRLRYDVLYHTDLSRSFGQTNGIDLARLNWGNYDLVVIDESHNFRNGGEVTGEEGKVNRYLKLMNKVIRAGVRTKVLIALGNAGQQPLHRPAQPARPGL